MCGIAGFWGDIPPGALFKMKNAISHRGPDGNGEWQKYTDHGLLSLAHVRLAIIDLTSTGAQPMASRCKRFIISFNGEIYNFRELKKRYLSNHPFLGTSDTEVLIELFAMLGVKAFSQLNGIFALSIYDLEKKCLYIARDPLGVKPLYYYNHKGNLLFASEIKSLLSSGVIEKNINYKVLSDYLTHMYSLTEDTPFQNIKQLTPGTYICFNSPIDSYAQSFEYEVRSSEKHSTYEDYMHSLRRVVTSGVERQLISDVKIDAFLSGGFDSSLITKLASDRSDEFPSDCYTLGNDICSMHKEGFVSDLPYAKSMAKFIGRNLIVVDPTNNLLEDLRIVLKYLEEPIPDPSAIATYTITKLASQNGVKVMLSGAGGDDIFSGYRRHVYAKFDSIIGIVPQAVRQRVENICGRVSTKKPLLRRIKRATQNISGNQGVRLASKFAWYDNSELCDIVTQEYHNADRIKDSIEYDITSAIKTMDPVNAMLFAEKKYYLARQNLMYTDKLSMANSIEARVPLLDLDVVNFAESIPMGYKVSGLKPKFLIKKAFQNYLPNEIIWRKKTGFGFSLERHFSESIICEAYDIIRQSKIAREGFLDEERVNKLALLSAQEQPFQLLYSLITLAIWSDVMFS